MTRGPSLSDSQRAPIDIERLVVTRLLVQANSGGGKSWCLRRILEQTHGLVQHLVIDPEGEFFTLREKLDYVLVAKSGGDALADPKLARLLATRLLELEASAILDVSELEAHERVRFVRLFLEGLMQAPRKLWHPCLVVLDEAHAYCPQKGDIESARAVIDLCVRGRKRGFAAMLATQRLSKLAKDAAAECINKLVGRTSLDVDMARAAEELGMGTREERLALRDLAPGTFFAYGPALSGGVKMVHVGTVRTTHPQAGSRIGRATPPPTEAIRALLPKIADLPKEAEAERVELEELRSEVRKLRSEARRPLPPTPVPVKISQAELGKVKAAIERALALPLPEPFAAEVRKLETREAAAAAALRDVLATLERLTAPLGALNPPPLARSFKRYNLPPSGVAVANAGRMFSDQMIGRSALTQPERRVVDALAWLEVLGEEQPDRRQVAAVSRYSPSSGGFRNLLSLLRTGERIEYVGEGCLRLTASGREIAIYPDSPPSGDQLRAMALEILDEPCRRVLRPLLEVGADGLARDEVAERAGYQASSGGFRNLLSRLRTLGFIEYREGRVVPESILFPEA